MSATAPVLVDESRLAPSPVTTIDSGPKSPRVAVVHDYLTQRGGAERVVLSMVRTFPEAPVYTSVYEPDGTFPGLHAADVRVTWMNRFAPLRRHHRAMFPVLAPVFSRTVVDAPVTLVSSSGWAHGVRATGRKVVYCYTPARWLYQSNVYLRNRGLASRMAIATCGVPLRRWDQRAARTAHRYVVTSSTVRDRVRAAYGVDAEVLPAPHSMDVHAERTPLDGVEPGFLLSVARLMPYKNTDAVVEAMRALPRERLVVVGRGPEEERLRHVAPANVRFTGTVSDAELRWLYGSCAGLVTASYEDFGLTTLEAGAFGKPVAALRWGGYRDTVHEGETGVYFETARPDRIAEAVRRLRATDWQASTLVAWAGCFCEEAFSSRLRAIVADEAAQL